jgi:hypothetical protein
LKPAWVAEQDPISKETKIKLALLDLLIFRSMVVICLLGDLIFFVLVILFSVEIFR